MSIPSFEDAKKKLENHIRNLVNQPILDFQEDNGKEGYVDSIKVRMVDVSIKGDLPIKAIGEVVIEWKDFSVEEIYTETKSTPPNGFPNPYADVPEIKDNMEGCPYNHAMGWDLDSYPECEMCAKHHYCRRK